MDNQNSYRAKLFEEVKSDRAAEGLSWAVASLMIGLVSLIVFPVSFVLGPIAIFLALRSRNLGQRKLGMIAMVLAFLFTLSGLLLTAVFGADLLYKANDRIDFEVKISQGRSLFYQGRHTESISVFESAVPLAVTDTKKSTAYYWIGNNYYVLQNYGLSERSQKEALKLDENYGQPYITLAKIYLNQLDLKKALIAAKKAVELETKDPEAHYVYGLSLKLNGKDNFARREFSLALELAPDNSTYQRELLKVGGDK